MKDAIVVLGMHRSGTSAVTGAVNLLGAAPPLTLMVGDQFNERGYFESRAIMDLNDAICASAGVSWSDWRAVDSSWFGTEAALGFRAQAASIVAAEFGAAPLIALKDPRICRFVPLWLGALEDAGYRSRCLLVVRNPLESAASLQMRDGSSAAHGLLMWLRHLLDAEKDSRTLPRSIVVWSDLVENPRAQFRRLSADLQVEWPRDLESAFDQIAQFISTDLHHQRIDVLELETRSDVSKWMTAAYDRLRRISANPTDAAAMRDLERVRREFDQASEMFGPAFVSLEEKLGQLGSEVTDARLAHDAAEARATAFQDLAHCRLGELNATTHERDALRTEVTGLRQAAERVAQAFENAKAELDLEREWAGTVGLALAKAREALCTEQNRLTLAENELIEVLKQYSAQKQALEAEVSQLQVNNESVMASTVWRISSTLASLAKRVPPPLRRVGARFFRKLLKA